MQSVRIVYELVRRVKLGKLYQGANTWHCCVVLRPNPTGPAFSTVNIQDVWP